MEQDLLSLLAVAELPVTVAAAARVLEVEAKDVLGAGDRLVAEGRIREEGGGYVLDPATTVEVGEARIAYLAGRLADALTGADGGDIGPLLLKAGRPADAFPVLADAVLGSGRRRTDQERGRLIADALTAMEKAKLHGGVTEGRLRLARARLLRSDGRSDEAAADLDLAVRRLDGEERVDALGFAAAVADDRQLPQEAETWVAMAELEATRLGLEAKLGSLLSFHGRELSRLGLPGEAESVLAKGQELVDRRGTPVQRFYTRMNRAWIDLDQGEVRRAEAAFARLREEAADLEGEASAADKEAYWARALFGVGRPKEALSALARSAALAERSSALAAVFIARLAEAEGALFFGRHEEALSASDRALEICIEHLPAWVNVCRTLRARALLLLGRSDEARIEATQAVEASPPGIDGMRWRMRADELLLETAERWDQRKAEDLTDQLLQSHWFGAAVELMTVRSGKEKDSDLGGQAAALAMQVGNPMLAAKALEAAGLWSDPMAAPVAAALRTVDRDIPDGWRPGWEELSWVRSAMSVVAEPAEDSLEMLRERIAEALATAGLSGDLVLSPAQRRASGLVRRRPRRRRGIVGWAAALIGVVAIAVVSAVVATNVLTPATLATTPVTTATTTTAAPVLEETLVAAPDNGLTGTAPYRGDVSRSGRMEGGLRQVTGRYWKAAPGGVVIGSPVAYGNYVFLATDENRIYGLQQRDSLINMTVGLGETITTPPAVGLPPGSDTAVVAVATADGMVHGYSALNTGPELWAYAIGARVSAPLLIVEGVVYAGAEDGRLHAFELGGGRSLWIYPKDEPAGSFETAPAFDGGIIYVGDLDGNLHLVRADTGEPVCTPAVPMIGGAIGTNPLVSDGVVFISLGIGGIPVFEAGSCGLPPDGYARQYPASPSNGLAPAMADGSLYLLEGRRLLAYLLDGAGWVEGATPSPWNSPFVADDFITTPPVVAGGVVNVGSQGGTVYGVDAASGEMLWSFSTGSAIRGEPIVVPGAVFVATASGEVWAIAGT